MAATRAPLLGARWNSALLGSKSAGSTYRRYGGDLCRTNLKITEPGMVHRALGLRLFGWLRAPPTLLSGSINYGLTSADCLHVPVPDRIGSSFGVGGRGGIVCIHGLLQPIHGIPQALRRHSGWKRWPSVSHLAEAQHVAVVRHCRCTGHGVTLLLHLHLRPHCPAHIHVGHLSDRVSGGESGHQAQNSDWREYGFHISSYLGAALDFRVDPTACSHLFMAQTDAGGAHDLSKISGRR